MTHPSQAWPTCPRDEVPATVDDHTSLSAARDWWRGTRNHDLWLTLAWYDILLRYRRSLLGPLWITISTGMLLLGMGPLYASLFSQPLDQFFPHLALGMIFWGFLSSSTTEGCHVFISGARYLKQPGFPQSALVWQLLTRNTIQLAHTLLLYAPVVLWANIPLRSNMLWFFPSFIAVVLNLHATILTLGLLNARFRDIAQIVSSAMTLIMFLTPIFWLPESLPSRAHFLLYNPYALLLEFVRKPLLGQAPCMSHVAALFGLTIANVAIAAITYARCRHKLPYWT